MKLLDLYCGAGGAAVGLVQAGFPVKNVVGVDIEPQPDYPFKFVQKDVMDLDESFLEGFDLIWASPPCQAFSNASASARQQGKVYPDLIAKTRNLLINSNTPYCMENVVQAPIRRDFILCGTMFKKKFIRHRKFEIWGFEVEKLLHPHHHTVKLIEKCGYATMAGNGQGKGVSSLLAWQRAMDIFWTENKHSIAEAVPPCYSKYIGEEFMRTHKDYASRAML